MEKKQKPLTQPTLFSFFPLKAIGDRLTEERQTEGREIGRLGEDGLEVVFSHLCQKDLINVLLVCKTWEKAVREGGVIWNNFLTMGSQKFRTQGEEGK